MVMIEDNKLVLFCYNLSKIDRYNSDFLIKDCYTNIYSYLVAFL